MLLDSFAQFASAEAVPTGGGATTLVGDVMDLSVVRDIGDGTPIWLVLQISTIIVGGTALQFILASDSQAAIDTTGNETRHYISDIFPVAELTQGFQIGVPLPMGDVSGGITPYEQFLGILVVGTGTQASGNINAFLTLTPPGSQRVYADANN